MPRHCPRCNAEYEDHVEVCWPCHVRLIEGIDEEEPGQEVVWVDYRPVYRAPDEFSALAVQRVLAEQDIQSLVRSAQIPWADGIMSTLKAYWGQLLVAPEDYVRARALVEEYLRSIGVDPGPSPNARS